MIKPAEASDFANLIELARGTGVFKPVELVTLQEVLDNYLARPRGDNFHAYTYVRDGQVLGFEIHGPNTMTDRTWDLYWIAVVKAEHARGIGTELLFFAEDDIQKASGRLIVIETSSLPSYEPTRRFYVKHGYEQAAQVKDFYADGDDQVIFRKRLTGEMAKIAD